MPQFRKNVVFLQPQIQMVGVAQLVRVPDCGSEGRGFESHLPLLLDFCLVSGKYVVLQGKNIKP